MNYLDIYFDCNFAEKNKIENEILWVYINLTTLSQKKNTLLDFSYIISKIIKRLASANDQTKIEMVIFYKNYKSEFYPRYFGSFTIFV